MRSECFGAPHRRGFGTKVELKNLNSVRFMQRAIEYEVERQIKALESGGRILQETRLWDERAAETRVMRSKEETHDYRYFPEPDLPPLVSDRNSWKKYDGNAGIARGPAQRFGGAVWFDVQRMLRN